VYHERSGCQELRDRRKGYCWIPETTWGMSGERLCELCRAKNIEAFVQAELLLSEAEPEGQADQPDPYCARCHFSRLRADTFARGERLCYVCKEILSYPNTRKKRESLNAKTMP